LSNRGSLSTAAQNPRRKEALVLPRSLGTNPIA
jgi:hypothetical protein